MNPGAIAQFLAAYVIEGLLDHDAIRIPLEPSLGNTEFRRSRGIPSFVNCEPSDEASCFVEATQSSQRVATRIVGRASEVIGPCHSGSAFPIVDVPTEHPISIAADGILEHRGLPEWLPRSADLFVVDEKSPPTQVFQAHESESFVDKIPRRFSSHLLRGGKLANAPIAIDGGEPVGTVTMDRLDGGRGRDGRKRA